MRSDDARMALPVLSRMQVSGEQRIAAGNLSSVTGRHKWQ